MKGTDTWFMVSRIERQNQTTCMQNSADRVQAIWRLDEVFDKFRK